MKTFLSLFFLAISATGFAAGTYTKSTITDLINSSEQIDLSRIPAGKEAFCYGVSDLQDSKLSPITRFHNFFYISDSTSEPGSKSKSGVIWKASDMSADKLNQVGSSQDSAMIRSKTLENVDQNQLAQILREEFADNLTAKNSITLASELFKNRTSKVTLTVASGNAEASKDLKVENYKFIFLSGFDLGTRANPRAVNYFIQGKLASSGQYSAMTSSISFCKIQNMTSAANTLYPKP